MSGTKTGGAKAAQTNLEKYPYHRFLEDGRVYSVKCKKFIKLQKDKDGYAICGVTRVDGSRLCVRVHRQVATIYIPNPDNKPFVNHMDGDKFNNDISNLEWCTAKENRRHAIDTGLFKDKGEDNGNSKLTNSQVYRIRELYDTGLLKQDEIAKVFSISQVQVGLIVNRKNWRHL